MPQTIHASAEATQQWTSEPPVEWDGDAQALGRELRRVLQGDVGFDNGSRALYATDASNYRQVPIGVVCPANVTDVEETLRICRSFGAPVLGRGGGTSLAGQCCNIAVVMDMSRHFNQILSIDPQRRVARVRPGTVLDNLRDAAEKDHLTFGPDPATHNHCTLGGMIGNNSCGVHSVLAGRTVDNVESLEVITYDGFRLKVGKTSEDELEAIIRSGGRRGDIYRSLKALRDKYAELIRQRYPDIPRRVSGYNLDQLLPEKGFHVARALVGTEGTCVTVLEAELRLIHSPPKRALALIGFDDAYHAADYVMEVMEHGPVGLEGLDRRLVEDNRKKGMNTRALQMFPEGGGWLLVEFGAETREEAREQAAGMIRELEGKEHVTGSKLFSDSAEETRIWEIRESGLGATARVPTEPDTWPGWEDSAVAPEHLGDYLREMRALLNRYEYDGAFYGHFGQGCLHTRITFDLKTRAGIEKYRRFVGEAADLVLRYDGSYSGEHGDGQSRAELLPKMYGPELCEAFREFKSIWDPDNRMNPGKVVAPYPITSNLRLGADFRPAHPTTHFQFPDDEYSFSRASLRCVGVGKCRREDGGTMCPSYMVTRDEKHSTRGRAHLLFEMLQGDVISDGWRDEAVKESLDLCLACKGCKGDCPINVDLATYKAEFLSHYYAGRLRPVTAYSMGLIYWWARLASIAPRFVNTLMDTPVISSILKRIGGIAAEREIPAFAVTSFRERFRQRKPRNVQGQTVILWPDTFNNFFHPETAEAAVEVLEAGGFHVKLPDSMLCCGRPLYDFGMLHLAKRQLRQIMDALRTEIEAGTCIVGLEPSCVATFRDELGNLFPRDEVANKLKRQTFLFSEFVHQHADKFDFPHLERRALIHGHCHHKSILGMEAEEKLFEQLGIEYDIVDSGCCGMAGSFGFEREKYDVSIECGERALLPAVREADARTLIVADGFSCREQVKQSTGRWPLHVAEVAQLAIQQRHHVPVYLPESFYASQRQSHKLSKKEIAVGLAGVAFGGWAAWSVWRRLSEHR